MTKYKQKDSFIIHHDTASIFEELTNEQAGELIKHLIFYSNSLNKNPKEPKKPSGFSSVILLLAHSFEKQLERDFWKYQAVCERNENNGKKGGRPPKLDKIKTQKNPKKPDSDSDSDSDKDNDKEKDTKEKDASAFSLSQSNCKENLDSSTSVKNRFDEFWNEWRAMCKAKGSPTGEKKPAEIEYKKAVKIAGHQGIMRTLEVFKSYILLAFENNKHACRWLKNIHWQDFENVIADYKQQTEILKTNLKKQGKPLPIAQKSPEKQQEEVKMKEDTQNKLEAIKSRLNAKEKEFNDYIKKEVLKSYFSPFHFESWIKNMVIKCEEGVATVDVFKDISLQWEKLQNILSREMLNKDFKFEKIEWKLID